MILKIRLSVIFIHDPRHGGAFGTISSLLISWNFHPSEVLPEPPSLPDSPTKGCCDWTEVSLSSCVSLPYGKLSRFPSFIFLALPFEVVAYGLRGCRDFIPAAGLTYSECCIFNFQAALKGFLFAPLLIGNWERRFVDVSLQNFFDFFQSRFNGTKNSHFINFFNCSDFFVGKSMNTM